MDDEPAFEDIYVEAGEDLARIPWAELAPHPALLAYLDGESGPGAGRPALVVGCGLGDDAEAVSERGFDVTAFDISPTALDLYARRFPGSRVHRVLADVLALPPAWHEAFALVVEFRTLQSLPLAQRARAVAAIAGTVAAGGSVWVRCLGREDGAPVHRRPWPVSRAELAGFTAAGLLERDLRVERSGPTGLTFTAVYERP